MCIVANSGSLTRELISLLSTGQRKPLQHLLSRMPLMRFFLRFAERQGQVGVACGTVEEQVGWIGNTKKNSPCHKAAKQRLFEC
jgi:hypothetical protein